THTHTHTYTLTHTLTYTLTHTHTHSQTHTLTHTHTHTYTLTHTLTHTQSNCVYTVSDTLLRMQGDYHLHPPDGSQRQQLEVALAVRSHMLHFCTITNRCRISGLTYERH